MGRSYPNKAGALIRKDWGTHTHIRKTAWAYFKQYYPYAVRPGLDIINVTEQARRNNLVSSIPPGPLLQFLPWLPSTMYYNL